MFRQNWRTKLNFNFSEWFCHLPMHRPPTKQIQNDVSQLDSHSTLTNNKKTSWKASADFLRPNKLIRSLEARPHFRKLVYGAHRNDRVYIMDVSDDILKEVVTTDQMPYPLAKTQRDAVMQTRANQDLCTCITIVWWLERDGSLTILISADTATAG